MTGVHTVISTIPASAQLSLIDACVKVGVKRYAPTEFEGMPDRRPVDALDRGRKAVHAKLRLLAGKIEYTSFVCGILYERFAQGGLRGLDMGIATGIGAEGDYLMNLRTMHATIPYATGRGMPVSIVMTAANDLARFVTKALDLPAWEREMAMAGERMTLQELVRVVEAIRGMFLHEVG